MKKKHLKALRLRENGLNWTKFGNGEVRKKNKYLLHYW